MTNNNQNIPETIGSNYAQYLSGIQNQSDPSLSPLFQPLTIIDQSTADQNSSNYKLGDALNGSLDWINEGKNMAINQSGTPDIPEKPVQDIRNQASIQEKARITAQKNSKEYSRSDFFSIGTVYLNIPPTQISISEEKHNFRYKTLRSGADIVTSSGRSTMRIDLSIMFNGLDDINNKLRPLIAQMKCTPFLPITNEYIRSVVEPETSSYNDTSDNTAEEAASDFDNAQAEIDAINSLISNKTSSITSLVGLMGQILAISPKFDINRATTFINQYYSDGSTTILSADPLAGSAVDNGTVDIKKYLYSLISLSGNISPESLKELVPVIAQAQNLAMSLDNISTTLKGIVSNDVDKRYSNRQIVGAVSQVTIATTPGFPESLTCSLSMYVFNYDPYSYDFSFVNGYNPKQYTPDLTQCDIFIDWYANRFLSPMGKPGSLGLYSPDNKLDFTYVTYFAYDDLITGKKPYVQTKSISMDADTMVTGMSVTMRNVIKFLPILSGSRPTCQYMGAYNGSVQINLNCTSKAKVSSIRKMLDGLSRISRRDNKQGRYNLLQISSQITNLCGYKHFIVDTFSVDTVPGSPGLYAISMDLSQVKMDQGRIEQLTRILTTDKDSVLSAVRYMLDSARLYVQDTSPLHSKTATYKYYYDFIMGGSGSSDTSEMELAINAAIGGDISNYYPDYATSSDFLSHKGKISSGGLTNDQILEIGQAVAAQPFNNGIANTFLQNSASQSIKDYISNIMGLFNNPDQNAKSKFLDGTPMSWSGEELFIAHAIAAHDFTNIANLLDPDSKGSEDLKGAVINAGIKGIGGAYNLVDSTCYPDLELPRYIDIANRNSFKLTYGDLGMLTLNPSMRNKPAQSDYVAIEPDAFHSRKSIHDILDNSGAPGLKAGLSNFYRLSQSCIMQAGKPKDPTEWTNLVYKSGHYNDDSYGNSVDDSNKKLQSALASNSTGPTNPNSVANGTSPANPSNGSIGNTSVTVTKALDGNTFLVQADGSSMQYAVRVLNYTPTPGNNVINNVPISSSPGIAPGPGLSLFGLGTNTPPQDNLVGMQIIIQVQNIGTVQKYGYNIINVTATMQDGTDIAEFMKAAGMSLQVDNTPNNIPQQTDDSELDDTFGEYAFGMLASEKLAVVNTIAQVVSGGLLSPNSLGNLENAAFGALGAVSSVKGGETEAKSVSVQGTPTSPTDAFTQRYIFAGWLANSQKDQLTENNTYQRFDRYSSTHIKEIAKRIRYQSKDDSLRMVKAFPTFKLYFIEEQRMDFVPLPSFFKSEVENPDELYRYDAVLSIDINKSRKEAADTCVLRILNTRGVLDRSRFGLFDPASNEQQQANVNNIDQRSKDTIDQAETIEEFILKPGTRIRVKMGYGSDPSYLENVFTGMVTENTQGDVITVVAQGYGVELQKQIVGWGNRIKYQDASCYKVLDKIIRRPEILHFGFAAWNTIINPSLRSLYRRLVPEKGNLGEDIYRDYGGPSIWRNYMGDLHIIERFTNQAGDNIFTPELSKIYEEFHGDGWEFQMENRTVWDIFQEMTERMPGYITQVLPFDNRATIYFGPSDGYYSYSNYVKALVGEQRASLEDPQGLIDSAVSNGDLALIDPNNNSQIIQQVSSLVDAAYQAGAFNADGNLFSSGPSASYVLQQTSIYLSGLGSASSAQVSLINSFRQIAENQELDGNNSGSLFMSPVVVMSPGNSIYLFKPLVGTREGMPSTPLYTKKNGSITDTNTYISKTTYANLMVPANMRMVRGYHYYDSLRNIISNNILASDENMWNKVEVITGIKGDLSIGSLFTPKSPTGYEIISAQLNDFIWKSRIKTKIFNRPNAQTPMVGWLYSLGNLILGINEMYTGELTILGDPTVKPHDVVFMNDYYTDMSGPFEVREVNHHFSHETGFVTTIVPDCITYANNAMAMATEAVAGGYYDDVANSMLWVYNVKVPFIHRITNNTFGQATAIGSAASLALSTAANPLSAVSGEGILANAARVAGSFIARTPFIRFGSSLASATVVAGRTAAAINPVGATALAVAGIVEATVGPAIRQQVSALQFAVSGLTLGRREPLNFVPLIYSNRPYIAGVEGMRRGKWWEAGAINLQEYIYYTFQRSSSYISQMADTYHSSALADGTGGNILK